jgi:hypothetical protein
MYVVTPFPDILSAITVGKGSGTLKWKFDPQPDPSA